jgi:hypothetical protein
MAAPFDGRPFVPENGRQGFIDARKFRQGRVDGRRRKRARRAVENAEFRAMLGRLLRAFVRRLGDGDPDDLPLAVSLANDVELVLCKVVARQRESGASWSQIGAQLGCSKQAAQQRFGGDSTRR